MCFLETHAVENVSGKKLVDNVSAGFLFGGDFSSDMFWSDFFSHFLVRMFPQEICGIESLSEEHGGEVSLQRFCL